MAAPISATAIGSLALAQYLDARFHIRNDIKTLFYNRNPKRAQRYIAEKIQQDRMLMYHILEDQVAKPAIADNLFLIFPADEKSYTYRQFLEQVNKVGNWLLQELELEIGELVALDGPNSPEYLILWFALDSIGACPCFLNHNLTKKSLEHCVKLSDARYCLVDDEIRHLVEPVEPFMDSCRVIYYSQQYFSSLSYPTTPPPPDRRRQIAQNSIKCLLYTSGTTGLPKAVVKTVAHELYTGYGIAKYLDLSPEDRIYTCLPLFHGAAHSLCVTPAINAGCTIIIGKKFSHSTFWPEIVKYKAGILQYVGELCRYLLNAKPSPLERQNKLRMAWGNGIRPDVWERFRQRFQIPMIHELYASSDGMGSMFNPNRGEFSQNCIGVRGLLWDMVCGQKEKIIKIDVDSQEIIRNPQTGFAIECPRGEAGEVIHWVNPEHPQAQFEGYYKNPQATQKRFVTDIFQKGDMWFRSSDMMRQDMSGRVYFVDRLGDTYRWKSENVSATEVSDILGQFPGVAECSVYGVLVPRADGRAGCAAIVLADGILEKEFDFKGLASHASANMPRFAVPIFLRMTSALNHTSTMKIQKGRLRQQGCDIDKVREAGDTMYWLPPNEVTYVPFSDDDYHRIQAGQANL